MARTLEEIKAARLRYGVSFAEHIKAEQNPLNRYLVCCMSRRILRARFPLTSPCERYFFCLINSFDSPCQSHSTLQLPTCCERLLALSNPCWTLPVGCSLVHRGQVKSTVNLYPAKGKAIVMSATTTSLEWPD